MLHYKILHIIFYRRPPFSIDSNAGFAGNPGDIAGADRGGNAPPAVNWGRSCGGGPIRIPPCIGPAYGGGGGGIGVPRAPLFISVSNWLCDMLLFIRDGPAGCMCGRGGPRWNAWLVHGRTWNGSCIALSPCTGGGCGCCCPDEYNTCIGSCWGKMGGGGTDAGGKG
jgi:hypothetical protein